jgi:hypothetical protein
MVDDKPIVGRCELCSMVHRLDYCPVERVEGTTTVYKHKQVSMGLVEKSDGSISTLKCNECGSTNIGVV